MRRYLLGMLAAISVLAPALAQQPKAERTLFGSRLGPAIVALESPTVRQDIKLSDAQADKLKPILEALEDAKKKVGDGRGGDFQRLSPEQKQARRAEFRKKLDELNEQAVAVLADDQRVRVRQIQIWIRRDGHYSPMRSARS